MGGTYEFLVQKEEMWARMLMEVLKDNGITATALSVYGAGLAIHTGKQELLNIFVPAENLTQAQELLQALFSAELIYEEEA